MGWFKKNKVQTVTVYKLIEERGSGYYSYSGNLYKSDLVRACIRPKAQAIGKSIAKHIRHGADQLVINPEPYIRFILEEPNPYMSGQMLQEKLIGQLMLNNNSYAFIQRDANGLPVGIYPIQAEQVTAYESAGALYLRFLVKGKNYTFDYADIIHLRRDYNADSFFGDSQADTLAPLMDVVATADQGLIKAIKNSNIIKWLLLYHIPLKDDDLTANAKKFVDSFLKIDDDNDSVGAAAIDSKMDAKQVEPKDYVPEAGLFARSAERVLSFFNTNAKIVQSDYTENDWIAYYEAEIEPCLVQLSNEYTRKLFTRRERGFGNRIVFGSSNLSFASMRTKLGLVALVDRGIMCPDEVREAFNMPPVPGGKGSVFIRRLDTEPIDVTLGGGEDDETN